VAPDTPVVELTCVCDSIDYGDNSEFGHVRFQDPSAAKACMEVCARARVCDADARNRRLLMANESCLAKLQRYVS
jgi:hypothetical protein